MKGNLLMYRLSLFLLIGLAVLAGHAAAQTPPGITLNAPVNNDTTTNGYMDISATVTADNPPMIVRIYGDTTADPSALILTEFPPTAVPPIPISFVNHDTP